MTNLMMQVKLNHMNMNIKYFSGYKKRQYFCFALLF